MKTSLLAVAFCTLVPVLSAATLTFDDLPAVATCCSTIPNGYGGLNWGNLSYRNGTDPSIPGSGYVNGLVSPPNIVFNGNGDPGSISSVTPFTLTSAYFAGAWNDGRFWSWRDCAGWAAATSEIIHQGREIFVHQVHQGARSDTLRGWASFDFGRGLFF